jgi:ANTAR domain
MVAMGSTRMKIHERIDVEALVKSIGSLQDLQFRQRGLEPAMQQVVDAAKALFRADGAGLMLIGRGEVLRWVTATDPRPGVGGGPGAARRGPLRGGVRAGHPPTDPGHRHRGALARADQGAAPRRVHAVLSMPVQVAQGTVGSLNFYLAEPHEWDHSERNAAEVYGRLAGALLGSALTAELQGRLIEQLQWALDHRILIEQAKAILMGREGISADVAYRRMRSAAPIVAAAGGRDAQIVVEGEPYQEASGRRPPGKLGRRPDRRRPSVRCGSAPGGPWRGRVLATTRRPPARSRPPRRPRTVATAPCRGPRRLPAWPQLGASGRSPAPAAFGPVVRRSRPGTGPRGCGPRL